MPRAASLGPPGMIQFLIQVAGAAALLIWSVRLVRTGVERAFMAQLRRLLRASARQALPAALGGCLAALGLQSSTAVTMLATGFVATGVLVAPAALAIILGADVGSALVVQILVTRADWIAPLLLLIGVTLFLKTTSKTWRQAGRILVGLALIFVSLAMIRAATEPFRDSTALAAGMRYLGGDPVTAFAIGGLFAWGVQSSVAAVLLVVAFAAQGIMPMGAAAAMVLGANLGGSFIPWMLTLAAPVAARRVVLGNILMRGGGAILVLGLMLRVDLPLSLLADTPARQTLLMHLIFNLAVALLALPLRTPVLRLAATLLPDPPAATDLKRLSALDPAALDHPDQGLSCAAREILHMGEEVEAMLRPVLRLYTEWDDATAQAILTKEQSVDQMHFDIKIYLARLSRHDSDPDHLRRVSQMVDVAANLEAAGDSIARLMLGLAQRMHKADLRFSETGWREIANFHDRVLGNAQAALNVQMSGNPDAARALVEEKDRMREIEQGLQRSHLARLREGRSESIETSNIHQETLRALKQVNTAFAMVAYPILSETGDLLSSRLAPAP